MLELWTDGSCLRNPNGPGGWAVVVVEDGRVVAEHAGHEASTTNNRMEMTAALEALRYLAPGEAATIHSDSQLLVNGATQWMAGWKRKGWKKADGQPVLNADLWQAIDAEMQRVKTARWNWVRGHAGSRWNERADVLAVQAARSGKGTSRVVADEAEPLAPGETRDAASSATAAAAIARLRAATAPTAPTAPPPPTTSSTTPTGQADPREPSPGPTRASAEEIEALRELERYVRAATAGSRAPEQLTVLLARLDAARRPAGRPVRRA